MAPIKKGDNTATKATTSTAKTTPAKKAATTSTAVNTATKSASSSAATCCSSSNGKSLTHDQIAQRAFEIWKQRGGSEEENWLQAEKELRSECK